MLSPQQIALLQQWNHAKEMLAQWQTYERQCRDAFADATFPGAEGSHTADAGNGYGVKFTRTMRYTVTDGPDMRGLVSKFATHGETSAAALELLKWKPSLGMKSYKALPAWGRNLMDAYITMTPNAPVLEIIPPR